MRAEQPPSTDSGRYTMKNPNIIRGTQTVTVTRSIAALPVDGATTDEIKSFLYGTDYRYSTAGAKDFPNLGLSALLIKTTVTRVGENLDVRPGDLLVKVDGEVKAPCSPAVFAERYDQ
jgi:hypothetical protein